MHTLLILTIRSAALNWKREFESWTNLNVLILQGSKLDRAVCKRLEMFSPNQVESAMVDDVFQPWLMPNSGGINYCTADSPFTSPDPLPSTYLDRVDFDVLLCTNESLLTEKDFVAGFSWAASIGAVSPSLTTEERRLSDRSEETAVIVRQNASKRASPFAFTMCVVDEAHRLRNRDGKLFRAMCTFNLVRLLLNFQRR